MITDYIEMTESGTPLLIDDREVKLVSDCGWSIQKGSWGSEDARGIGLGPQHRAASGNL